MENIIYLQYSIEELNFTNDYFKIKDKLLSDKIRMINRLQSELKCCNLNKTASMENYLDQSMEGVITSLISGVFKVVSTIIKSILKFIGKIIGFIMNVVLGLAKRIIHFLTRPKPVPKEKQNKILQFIQKFKSSENYFSVEDDETNKNVQHSSGNKIQDIVKLLESKIAEISNYVRENKSNFVKSIYSEIMECKDINAMCVCMDKKEQKVDSLFSKNLYDARDSLFKLGTTCSDAVKNHRNINPEVRNECIEREKQLTKVLDEMNNTQAKELPTQNIAYKLASISFNDNFTATCKQFINKFEFNTNKHLNERIRNLEKELKKLEDYVEKFVDFPGKADHIKEDLNVFKKSMQNFSSICMRILHIDAGVKNMNIKILNTMVTFVNGAAKIA